MKDDETTSNPWYAVLTVAAIFGGGWLFGSTVRDHYAKGNAPDVRTIVRQELCGPGFTVRTFDGGWSCCAESGCVDWVKP